MNPFLVIIRAGDRLFKSGIKRRISRESRRNRLLAIDNEPKELCLESGYHVYHKWSLTICDGCFDTLKSSKMQS